MDSDNNPNAVEAPNAEAHTGERYFTRIFVTNFSGQRLRP